MMDRMKQAESRLAAGDTFVGEVFAPSEFAHEGETLLGFLASTSDGGFRLYSASSCRGASPLFKEQMAHLARHMKIGYVNDDSRNMVEAALAM